LAGVETTITPSFDYDVIRFEYSSVLAADNEVDFTFYEMDRNFTNSVIELE